MTGKDADLLYEKIEKHLTCNYPMLCLDERKVFAQSILQSFLTFEERHKRQSHQSIGQATVDHFRRTYGRKGRRPNEGKNPKKVGKRQAERAAEIIRPKPGAVIPGHVTHQPDVDFPNYVGFLKDPRSKALVILRFQWAFNKLETAVVLGVTESRVCQQEKKILEFLRKRVMREWNPLMRSRSPSE